MLAGAAEESSAAEEASAGNGKKKKGKAKKEKKKEALSSKASNAKQSGKRGPQAETEEPPATECSVCGQQFASRSKLFRHIRESGHAALKG